MAPAKKKPPVTGYRQASDKGRPTKSTPQRRPTSAMPGPRPQTPTRTASARPSGQKLLTGAAPKGALPAAGKTGGSAAPKGTTVPQRGGPTRTAAQQAQARRSAAAAKGAGAARGSGPSRTATAATAAKKGGLPKGAGAALSGVGEFANRVGRGESGMKALGGALVNAGTYAAGAAKGAQFGAKLGPAGAIAGGILGGLGASQLGGAAYDALTTQKASKYGPRFKNAGTGASAAKGAKPAAKPAASTSRFAGARDAAMAKAKGIKGSPVVGPKTASAPARMSAPAARSSAPSAPKASAPKAAAPKASAPKATAPSGPARMSASTYNRMSGNYGTSRSNNPLMADFKDSLPSKAAEPDAGYSPKTKVSGEGIKGAPTDVTKLAFSNPKLSAERTRKIKRG